MQTELIISGFGGQGILFAGTVLAYAGLAAGKNVTWIPSYGPEMRGGTANVTVIISDEDIGSPLVRCPAAALVLNQPSLEKYNPLVKPGGVLVYNRSLTSDSPQPRRADLTYLALAASDLAMEIGHVKMANIVGLGALVAVTQVLPIAAIRQALHHQLPEDKFDLRAANEEALRCGLKLARSIAA
jgi:2-oxoglutarate ferredoxin oxidoreductase subunit gamma